MKRAITIRQVKLPSLANFAEVQFDIYWTERTGKRWRNYREHNTVSVRPDEPLHDICRDCWRYQQMVIRDPGRCHERVRFHNDIYEEMKIHLQAALENRFLGGDEMYSWIYIGNKDEDEKAEHWRTYAPNGGLADVCRPVHVSMKHSLGRRYWCRVTDICRTDWVYRNELDTSVCRAQVDTPCCTT